MTEQLAETSEETTQVKEQVLTPSALTDLHPKMKLSGKVERLELYGAFIDLGVGQSAILHISKMGEKVNRIEDALAIGDSVEVWVETVDPTKGQITVTKIEPLAVEWTDLKEGQVYTGTITRLEKYGAFVDIGAEKDGLVHISELSHDYLKHPSEAVKVGDEVKVQVLGFNKRKRRIDLSRKAILESPEEAAVEQTIEEPDDEDIELATAMEIAMRRALDQSDDPKIVHTKAKKDRPAKSHKRDKQEDILSRTLKLSQESES